MKIYNPATEELLRELPEDTQSSLEEKYQKLKAGQKAWAKTPLHDRIDAAAGFYDHLTDNLDKYAKDLSLEMGKPFEEAKGEISAAQDRIRYFLDHANGWLKPEQQAITDYDVLEVLGYEPHGVIGNISAWNYPFLVGVNVFIPALIAGNAVLYKPSEHSTLTGLNIQEALYAAEVPEDVFQIAIGAGDVGKAMLELPLDGYFFTGSYSTGKAIAQAVAHKLVPVGLELGGKDPIYIMDDVEDVAETAAKIVGGCFYNNGQSCCAVERVYVHENIYDEFVENFVKETKKLKVGNPLEAGTTQGSLARPQHLDFLLKQVEDAVAKGATLLTGGKIIEGKGAFFEPTVFTNVNHDMDLMKKETFGPVIGIQKVSSDEEALQLMLDTEFGLTGGVYSKDRARAKLVLEELDAGTVYWNCCDRVSPHLPWSGRKNSGMGSTLSYLGILAFAKPKGFHFKGKGF